MDGKNLWWGYKHTNGSLQAKRYFDSRDTAEARESPFCETVIQPFLAENREDALKIIKSQLN